MEELLRFQHGTTEAILDSDGKVMDDIFGIRNTRFPSYSATLVQDFGCAKGFAWLKQSMNGSRAIVVEVELAESEVRSEGPIEGYEQEGFSTNWKVPAADVPETFLKTQETSRELAIANEKFGIYEYYKIPKERVVAVTRV